MVSESFGDRIDVGAEGLPAVKEMFAQVGSRHCQQRVRSHVLLIWLNMHLNKRRISRDLDDQRLEQTALCHPREERSQRQDINAIFRTQFVGPLVDQPAPAQSRQWFDGSEPAAKFP